MMMFEMFEMFEMFVMFVMFVMFEMFEMFKMFVMFEMFVMFVMVVTHFFNLLGADACHLFAVVNGLRHTHLVLHFHNLLHYLLYFHYFLHRRLEDWHRRSFFDRLCRRLLYYLYGRSRNHRFWLNDNRRGLNYSRGGRGRRLRDCVSLSLFGCL
jgi:hypothetical protein